MHFGSHSLQPVCLLSDGEMNSTSERFGRSGDKHALQARWKTLQEIH